MMNDQIIQIGRIPRIPRIPRISQLAIFDFDWTIVKPKTCHTFPKDAADWQYLRPSVKQTLQEFTTTHHIVIVTNQSKAWKIEQIQSVLGDLQIESITVIIGVHTKKPDTTLFHSVFPEKQLQKESSLYVGDAAGRPGDWSDSDRVFAERLGIPFFTPEQIFPTINFTINPIPPFVGREVVIMVGYPGSGKSTIAKTLEDVGYCIVDGDTYKTAPKMIAKAKQHLTESIVFDSTAGTKKKRATFIQFARDQHIPVRVVWVSSSIEQSMDQNKQRAADGVKNKVPDIVFYVFRKKFEEPTDDEGCTIIVR